MYLNILVIFATFAFTANLVSAGNVVCYFTSWTVYRPGNGKYDVSDLPPDLCTHIHYGFVGLQESNGALDIMDDWEANGLHELEHLKEKRIQNPDLKLIVSMGGWNEGSEKYSHVAADPVLRQNMIKTVLDFLDTYEFNGFDLDWEYPNQRGGQEQDVENFILLLRELKDALAPKNYSLSVAVSGGIVSANISYDFIKLGEVVDLINVMAYDYHGAFDNYVGHYAPLNASHLDYTDVLRGLNVISGINFWIEHKVPLLKMNLGLGTYGRCFTLADRKNTSLYAPTVGEGCTAGPYTRQAGTLGYNEICEFDSDYEYVWDDEQEVPHLVKGDQWIGYDDIRSIELKAQFAKSVGLGGLMFWSLDTDDFRGICGNSKYPIINAAKNAFNGN